MKTWLHFVLMSIALLVITERALAITARGAQSCGTWIKERNAKNESYERAWLTGLLTGLAIADGKEFWGGVDTRFNLLDNESVYLWMDNYCRTNPLKNLVDGGKDLYIEQTKGR